MSNKNMLLPCAKCPEVRAKNQSYCIQHRREYERLWKKTDKGRLKGQADAVKRLYKITLEQYRALILQPCEICGIKKKPHLMGKVFRSQMHIDHDHLTGEIRGVLCNTCNTGLGSFKDNPELLNKAILYLKKVSNTSVCSTSAVCLASNQERRVQFLPHAPNNLP